MNKTDIEYLDYTWNPIAMRCTPVSEGCAHCWHLRMADRLREDRPAVPGLQAPRNDGRVGDDEEGGGDDHEGPTGEEVP